MQLARPILKACGAPGKLPAAWANSCKLKGGISSFRGPRLPHSVHNHSLLSLVVLFSSESLQWPRSLTVVSESIIVPSHRTYKTCTHHIEASDSSTQTLPPEMKMAVQHSRFCLKILSSLPFLSTIYILNLSIAPLTTVELKISDLKVTCVQLIR